MAARTMTRFVQPWARRSSVLVGRKIRSSLLPFSKCFTPHLPIATYCSSGYCWKPLLVKEFDNLACEASDAKYSNCAAAAAGDKHHWLVMFLTSDFQFPTDKALLDFYVRRLATVVGSEEEAKRKIYLVSCGETLGVGVDIDEDTINKLKGVHVLEDCYYGSRDEKDFSVAAQFNLKNRNYRLDNIFCYHHLSKRSSSWKSDHWLINIKQPYGGFANIPQTVEYCIKVLAKALGSEEEAIEKIYMIWFKSPCGFAAKIDKKTTKKLEGLPDVLRVLPDYAFDVKEDNALFIFPP